MPKTDPFIYCPLLEWYLTARDADCGVRSSFASQVAAIEGHRGSYGGADRFQSEQVEFGTIQAAFSKDRVMRRRWGRLAANARDILAAHYTGSARIGSFGKCVGRCSCATHGFQRFPRGFEALLGKFSGVALFLADRDGTLPALVRACELNAPSLSAFRDNAEAACRAAHRAYYEIAEDDEHELMEPHPLSGMFAAEVGSNDTLLAQRDGIWRQR